MNLWWIGGIEHNLLRLVDATPDWTHEIVVKALGERRTDAVDPVAEGLAAARGTALTPWRTYEASGADAVIYHNQSGAAPGSAALGRPVVSVWHGWATRGYVPDALNTGVNSHTVEILRIRQGLDLLPSLHPGIGAVRQKGGYALHDPPIIGLIASPRPEKFSPMLVAALNRLASKRPFQFRALGMALLARFFRRARFDHELLVPETRWEEKEGFLLGLDVGLHLVGCIEGFGIACQEMLAAGIPVVADDRGGPRDQITHEVNGLLVANVTAAVNALELLLSDAPLRQRLGRAAAERVAIQYSLADFRERYERAIALALIRVQ